jgi:hypothetical protein
MTIDDTDLEIEELHRAVARLRASVMAVVFGGVGGTGLFVATVWLLIRGGPVIGPHLGLLGEYFPGYHVTWPGAVVGFFYGAVTGALLGWSVAWVYNLVVDSRRRA